MRLYDAAESAEDSMFHRINLSILRSKAIVEKFLGQEDADLFMTQYGYPYNDAPNLVRKVLSFLEMTAYRRRD
jgi:hypothetical protein